MSIKHIGIVAGLPFLVLLSACAKQYERIGPSIARSDPSKLSDLYTEIDHFSRLATVRRVWIEASDIELPPTPGKDEPEPSINYTFFVNAQGTFGSTVAADLASGALRVDVIGADAAVDPVTYSGSTSLAGRAVKVTINSRQVYGAVSIVAWYVKEFEAFEMSRAETINRLQVALKRVVEEKPNKASDSDTPDRDRASREKQLQRQLEQTIAQPNPYGEVRQLKVFNGDLHTRILMLSEDEIKDTFGRNFSRYFFVGRVYLRNKHETKKLVLNTTSLRARCIFYRGASREAAKFFFGEDTNGRLQYLLNYDPSNMLAATQTGISRDELKKGAAYIRNAMPELADSAAPQVALAARLDALHSPTKDRAEEYEKITSKLFEALRGLYLRQLKEAEVLDRPGGKDYEHMLNSRIWPKGEAISEGDRQPAADRWRVQIEDTIREVIEPALALPSPVRQALAMKVSPTEKRMASSPNIFRQGQLAGNGYMFEDFYRPMPFQAVLISLLRKEESDPLRTALRVLETVGVVAGAIVGIDAFGAFAVGRDYATVTAVSTSVFLPEARKLLLQNIDQYLTNLGSLGLDTVIELEPNSSREGYVFFPRGPIFGFGVDEFTIDEASFIVNIDNDDVAVDGLLVERSTPIVGGLANTLVDQARTAGKSERAKRDQDLQNMQERLRGYALAALEADVRASLPANMAKAKQLISAFEASYGSHDLSGVLARLKAETTADMTGLRLETESFEMIHSLELQPVASDSTAVSAKYSLRLDHAVKAGDVVNVTVTAPPGGTVALIGGSATPRSKLTLRFEAAASDTGHVWSDPFTVEINMPAAAVKTGSAVHHEVNSSDASFAGMRPLPVSVPVAK